MLRTRLWMGAILIVLSIGVLAVDQWLLPWSPFLFVLILSLSLLACYELLHLLDERIRPVPWLSYTAVAAVLVANWAPHLLGPVASTSSLQRNPWFWVAGGLAATVLVTFILEMVRFQVPGGSVARIALTIWIVAYLSLLPSFLAQLRWLDNVGDGGGARRATAALAIAIFVPKCCDIGAYFTGRFLGRHAMAPTLSPKKTWEGVAGGLAAAAVAALMIDRVGPVVRGGAAAALALGIVLGVAGILGDLAESLIKRDCGQKDASQVLPGFGGVLDVVDSILFAAPVAYCWLQYS